MKFETRITKLFALAGLLTIAPVVTAAVGDQTPVDPVGLIEQHLPGGAALPTATIEELSQGLRNAVLANPEWIGDIVGAAAGERPDALADVVMVATAANPDMVGEIVYAAARAKPELVNDVVMAALRVLPEELETICFAAGQGAPEHARHVPVCLEAIEAGIRLDVMPGVVPVRDDPSPIRPR